MKIKNIILYFLTILIFNIPLIVFADSEIEAEIDTIISKLNNIEKNVFLKNYPIGSIYITTSSDENTAAKIATKYGGTWEAYGTNRTLRGTTGTASSTGGASTVTLTTSHLPSHTHTISHTHATPATTISSSGAHTHSTSAKTVSGISVTSGSAGGHSHSFDVGGTALVNYSDTAIYTAGYLIKANSGWWNGHNKKNQVIASAGAHSHSVTGSISVPSFSISSSGAHTHTVPAMTTGAASTSNSGSTGSGSSFSILDSYITVYMYKRTA
ncbi:MAG: hypothetical protein E7157_01680 [Lactobacillales bacterium]|nr:hypothetical protein [Lactobacillales bacterium]